MDSPQKTALVLSGGSIKGAFQAGAIQAIMESGFKPDFIYGISVGALNGSFVCSEAGKQMKPKESLDWNLIAANLVKFWTDNIKQPSDVADQRNWTTIGWDAIWNKFDGLVDTDPIQTLVKKNILIDNLYKSPIGLKVGAVNVVDSTIVYADPSYPGFMQYVLASSAIPMVMPIVNIGDQPFVDGGVMDVAPLKPAIESGATDVIVIACQSKDLGGASFDTGNLLQLTDRVFDIMVNTIVNNDIEWADYFNQYLPNDGTTETQGPLAGYRRINIRTVRPPVPIQLDLQNFNSNDIQDLIKTGYQAAKEQLK